MRKTYIIFSVVCGLILYIIGEYTQNVSMRLSLTAEGVTNVQKQDRVCGQNNTMDLANWMSNLPRGRLDISLNELAIPGTHNSFTFSLDPSSEMGPRVTKILKLVYSLARGVVYGWCVTQDQTVYEQLESGIRYLDLRVAYRPGYTELFFVHGFYGKEVEVGLREIDKFLEAHPKEVVIIDFHQFHNISEKNHLALVATIRRVFGNKLCNYIGFGDLTLNRMWESGYQVVVVYYHEISEEVPFLWPADRSIRFRWADTHSVRTLIRSLNSFYLQEKGPELYVYQAVLAPDTNFVLGHVFGSIKTDLAAQALPAILSWLRNKAPGRRGVNICIADFTDLLGGAFVKEVIRLNYQYDD